MRLNKRKCRSIASRANKSLSLSWRELEIAAMHHPDTIQFSRLRDFYRRIIVRHGEFYPTSRDRARRRYASRFAVQLIRTSRRERKVRIYRAAGNIRPRRDRLGVIVIRLISLDLRPLGFAADSGPSPPPCRPTCRLSNRDTDASLLPFEEKRPTLLLLAPEKSRCEKIAGLSMRTLRVERSAEQERSDKRNKTGKKEEEVFEAYR